MAANLTVAGVVYENFALIDPATGLPVSQSAPFPVDNRGLPTVARQLAAGVASANTALTTTCRRVSLRARTAAIRYAVGTSAQTASATSHFIDVNERMEIDVPGPTPNIAVIRDGATDGVLELSELA